MHFKIMLGNHIRKSHGVSCCLFVLLRGHRNAWADCLYVYCLYVSGIADAETIGRLARAAEAPVNLVLGLAGSPLSVTQLEDLGAKQFSIGGSLAHSTFQVIQRAAKEIRDRDTFSNYESRVLDAELCRFFVSQKEVSMP